MWGYLISIVYFSFHSAFCYMGVKTSVTAMFMAVNVAINSSQSLNLRGHQGTTDDVATIPFHPSLSSTAFRESPNPIPIHSLMLSSHLFFCLPLFLAPFTVSCRIVFSMPEDLEMWLFHPSFLFFSHCILDSVANLLVRHMVFVGNIQNSPIASHLKGLDPSLDFCCQGPALTGIKEGR